MEKEEKKGFWASLFGGKQKKCECGQPEIVAAVYADSAVKEIKVLGPGCSKCKSTYAVVEKVVKSTGADVKLTKVDDIQKIMSYDILSTPAIVADGKVVLSGKVPTEAEVRKILGL